MPGAGVEYPQADPPHPRDSFRRMKECHAFGRASCAWPGPLRDPEIGPAIDPNLGPRKHVTRTDEHPLLSLLLGFCGGDGDCSVSGGGADLGPDSAVRSRPIFAASLHLLVGSSLSALLARMSDSYRRTREDRTEHCLRSRG